MRMYGYVDEGKSPAEIVPEQLAEVTLCATPKELRSISRFLEFCADEMVRMGAKYDHIHLADRIRAFEASPHFVVASSQEKTDR